MESEKDNRINLFKLPEGTGALFELKKNPSDTQEVLEFKYVNKKKVTHNTFIYTYELPNDLTLGLNIGQHIAIDADICTKDCPEGEPVCRKYTPVSHIMDKGKFELLVKVYFSDIDPRWPEGGKMSQWLNNLELENKIQVRGPFGKLSYFGDGQFKILKKFKPVTYDERRFKKVGMIAAGTGITPVYQILHAAHLNGDSSEFSLIFANRSRDDILLKEELDEISQKQNFKFNLLYTIDKKEEGWDGAVGYISHEMINAHLPEPDDETIILICGPPDFCKKFIIPMLKEIGHKADNIFEF